MWTQNKLYHPQNPRPEPTRPKWSRRAGDRHNREFIAVLARSISGKQYLSERMDYWDRKLVADDIATGQVYDACAVFAWNPVEDWAKDISEEIALDIHQRYGLTRSSAAFLADYITWGNK